MELGKKIFQHFPELKKWYGRYIPKEKFDDYIEYDFIDIENCKIDLFLNIEDFKVKPMAYFERQIEIITCSLTIYTSRYGYSFQFRRPDENSKNGDIWGICEDFEFGEGEYDEFDFREMMIKVLAIEGIKYDSVYKDKSRQLFFKKLITIDLVKYR